MNTLITYPRTGTHWTRRRIEVLARWAGGRHLKVRYDHGKFHPKFHDPDDAGWVMREDHGQLFALIREARRVVVSNWHWIMARGTEMRLYGHEEYRTLESYVPYGARRYAAYLNWLPTLELVQFYFSEDTACEQFVREEIPRIIGVDYDPPDEAVVAVMKAGKEKVNLVGANHDAVPRELLHRIDSIIKDECRFEPYRVRYDI